MADETKECGPFACVVVGVFAATRLPPSLDDGRAVVIEEVDDEVLVDVVDEEVVGEVLELDEDDEELDGWLLLDDAVLVFPADPPKGLAPKSP